MCGASAGVAARVFTEARPNAVTWKHPQRERKALRVTHASLVMNAYCVSSLLTGRLCASSGAGAHRT
eukprot:4064110-Pyramimonas_sp.AAC.2